MTIKRSKANSGICFVINDYNWQTDTHYRHLYQLMELVSKECDVTVLVEKPLAAATDKVHDLDNLLIVQKQRHAFGRAIEELTLMWKIIRHGYKRFYVHYSKFGGISASIVSWFFNGRVYYWHCEEIGKHRPKNFFNLAALRTWLQTEGATRLTMTLVNRIVTGNQSMAEYYHNLLGIPSQKIKILPNYIDATEFEHITRKQARTKLGIPEEKQVVLFVHRLHERKGVHYLPKIIEHVAESHPSSHFLIVGDGPYRTKLIEQIAQLHLEAHVQVVGSVPNADIPLYFAASDIFIMPSDVEGFPRVLLEAMAGGLPIVATDVGGVRQVLEGAQLDFLVNAGDMDTFTQKICRLLDSPDQAAALATFGKQRVQLFSVKQAAATFLQLLSATPTS